jgi:hypothetical protein
MDLFGKKKKTGKWIVVYDEGFLGGGLHVITEDEYGMKFKDLHITAIKEGNADVEMPLFFDSQKEAEAWIKSDFPFEVKGRPTAVQF